jgi:hypothetical protein
VGRGGGSGRAELDLDGGHALEPLGGRQVRHPMTGGHPG